MMRTIDTSVTADGITIRLVEREARPRYVITQSDASICGFHPVADNIRMAKAMFEMWITKLRLIGLIND